MATSYHLEVLRKQRIIDRATEARKRLEEKEQQESTLLEEEGKKRESLDQTRSTSRGNKRQDATKDSDVSRASSAISSFSKSSHKTSSKHSERSHTPLKPSSTEGSVRRGSQHTTPQEEGDRSRPSSGVSSKGGTPANRSRPSSGAPSKTSIPANRSRPSSAPSKSGTPAADHSRLSSGHSKQSRSRQTTPANQSRQPSACSNVSNSHSETRRLASDHLQGSVTPSAASQHSTGSSQRAEETMSQVSGEEEGIVKPRLSTAELRAQVVRIQLQQQEKLLRDSNLVMGTVSVEDSDEFH